LRGRDCGDDLAALGAVVFYEDRAQDSNNRSRFAPIWRAVIEIAFIVFLFYSNLLMGEFTVVNGRGKNLAFALNDVFTSTNLVIAAVSGLVGYVVFEYLRKRL